MKILMPSIKELRDRAMKTKKKEERRILNDIKNTMVRDAGFGRTHLDLNLRDLRTILMPETIKALVDCLQQKNYKVIATDNSLRIVWSYP